jgi:hypothetical protein
LTDTHTYIILDSKGNVFLPWFWSRDLFAGFWTEKSAAGAAAADQAGKN